MIYLEYRVHELIEKKRLSGVVLMTEGSLTIWDSREPEPLGIWPARSGGWGNGAIPLGVYKLGLPTTLVDIPDNAPYKGEGVPWWISIKSPEYVSMSGLGLHGDGNLVGSLGCVMPIERDMEFFRKMNELVIKELRVT